MTPKSSIRILLSKINVIKIKKFIVIKPLNQSIRSALEGNQAMLHLDYFIGFWNSVITFKNDDVIT